jgi:hypothetical protein
MAEPRIPVFLAVGFWVASGLAVASYTYIAFRETAHGPIESSLAAGGNPALVASGNVLSAALTPSQKPLERGKFRPSK